MPCYGHRHLAAWSRAATFVAFAAVAPRALSQDVTYTGMVQFATGDYLFAERTRSLYVVNGLTVATGRLAFSVSWPLIVQSTPWISNTGSGLVPSGGPEQGYVGGQGLHDGEHGRGKKKQPIVLPDTTVYDQAGFGDPFAEVSIGLFEERGLRPAARMKASVKVPVADPERGFGTGAWDYGAGLSLAKILGGVMLFVDAAYWRLGNMPLLALKDPLSGSLGMGTLLADGKVGLLASVAGSTEVIPEGGAALQAGLGLSYLFSGGSGLHGGVALGLADAVPDAVVSLGWYVRL